MKQDSSTELFFQLMRVALGNSTEFPHNLSDAQWEELYEISKRQTLTGIAYQGIEKLPEEKRPHKNLIIQWYLVCNTIKRQNERLNNYAHKVSERFLHDGFKSCILKGQGIAQLYPKPEYRHSGDIDIWLDGTREEIIRYINKICPNCEPVYHHVDFPVLKEISIEVHFTPTWMNEYFANRKLQAFFKENAEVSFNNSTDLGNGLKINAPTLAFNRLFILLHIYRHLFAEGVGLRQLLDYYMVLTSGFTSEEKNETSIKLKELRLYGFAQATMYVLQKVFGMPDKYLIVQPDKKQGEFLINEIMLAGNFGQYNNKEKDKLYNKNIFIRFTYKIRRNLRYIKYHPIEVIYSPLFKIWHYFWRKRIKSKILK